MRQVYECEFCSEISSNKKEIIEHEEKCGSNPKNSINDETVIKLSRIYDHFKESLVYVLLNDYTDEQIEFYCNEFDRATRNNCPASVYEQKREMYDIFLDRAHIKKKELNWFNKITMRDNPELIKAIRCYFMNPEFRTRGNNK